MSTSRFFREIVDVRDALNRSPELPFSRMLSESQIQSVLRELKVLYRERIYTPCVTLWVFLSQVLSPDHSCRDAVARLLAFRVARGMPVCSTDTNSYCQARKRLPEALLSGLVQRTGKDLHQRTPEAWRLHGRQIKIVDGSTVSMPDTRSNEAAFQKPSNQRGKSGFPVARILTIFCLATGAVLQAAIGAYRGKNTSELSLLRQLQDTLEKGDILLGDRFFCTYFIIARLVEHGVDVVFRQHMHRQTDFRRGKKLGQEDHWVHWKKPTSRPDWMSKDEFAAMPAELAVREVRIRVSTPGFRVKSLTVVTTLVDVDKFSKADLVQLFRQRWHAELDIRSIKSVMKMDVLRGLTADMIRKEIWAHLLAYNLLRSIMCETAIEKQMPVREISFKGTLQILNSFYAIITTCDSNQLDELCTALLNAVSQHHVGNRPNRYEPRKIKRAAKAYPAMKRSRKDERKLCL